jgi:hypothetical protein
LTFTKLHDIISQKTELFQIRRDFIKLYKWVLHQDNALAHNAVSVRQFLMYKWILLMEHPSYSPDLALCDIFLLHTLKTSLKGTHFWVTGGDSASYVTHAKSDVILSIPEILPNVAKKNSFMQSCQRESL